MKQVIVNADDFGFSPHTIEWTIKGFEAGLLSSATIMSGMPSAEKAVEYALRHPEFTFGLHWYMTDQLPVSPIDEIPSLIDPSTGKLWVTRKFISLIFKRKIRLNDVKQELRAQYNWLKVRGVPISHVDGHGHMHRLPVTLQALISLRHELSITRVRRCQNVYYHPAGWRSRWFNNLMQIPLGVYFKSTDYMLMTANKLHAGDEDWMRLFLQHIPDGCTEIGIHPGIDAQWRKMDCEEYFKMNCSFFAENNIQCINYKNI